MYWRDVLTMLGFEHIEGNRYKHDFWEFDFTSRQSTDAIFAEIWDVAQHYGEEKRAKEIMANIFERR